MQKINLTIGVLRKDNMRQHVKNVHGKELDDMDKTGDQIPRNEPTFSATIITRAIPIENLEHVVYMHL